MIRGLKIVAGAALAALLFAPAALPRKTLLAGRAANAPSVFTPDRGKFRITINGQQIGSEDFSISASGDQWVAHSTTSAHAPGGVEIKASGELRLAPDGAPVHYEWSAEAQKKASGTVDFSGGTAKCVGDFGTPNPLRKDFKFDSPHVAVLDNNLYYQYAILARQYDWKAGGKQDFSVVIPQDMVPGTISVESVSAPTAGKGASEALRASTPDIEILLYLDRDHRLVRLEVPSSNAIIERE